MFEITKDSLWLSAISRCQFFIVILALCAREFMPFLLCPKTKVFEHPDLRQNGVKTKSAFNAFILFGLSEIKKNFQNFKKTVANKL